MTKCSRRIFGLSVVVACIASNLMVAAPGAVAEVPNSCNSLNYYAQQWIVHGTTDGQYGQFYTYDGYVGNTSSEFIDNHLYEEAGSLTLPEVEVGWYKGYGPQSQTSAPEYYYTTYSNGVYTEHDSKVYPTVGSVRLYELLYTGEDYSTGKAKWSVYWATLNSPAANVEVANLFGGEPLSGAEANVSSDVDLQADGAYQQVQSTSGTWSNWTTSDVTYQCNDAPYDFTIVAAYTQFTVTTT